MFVPYFVLVSMPYFMELFDDKGPPLPLPHIA